MILKPSVSWQSGLLYGAWLLAALFQVGRSAHFFEFTNSDRNLQTQITQNWLAGEGISLKTVSGSDLSHTLYPTSFHWPPAYHWLQAAVYPLCQDWFLSARWVHYLGIFCLFLVFQGLWRRHSPRHFSWGEGLFWLGWAVSFAPFHYWGSTDLWAVSCLFGGLWFMLKFQDQSSWYWLAACLLSLSFGLHVRWSFYPFLLLPGLLLIPKTKAMFSFHKWKPAVMATVGIGLLCLPLILWQGMADDQQAYFSLRAYVATEDRWFPEHWLRMDPFLIKSFWYLYPPKLAEWLQIPVGILLATMWSGMIAILLGLIKQSRLTLRNYWNSWEFWLIGLTILPLMGLSLFVPLEDWGEGITWTYVEESRYFAPVMCLIWWGLARGFAHFPFWLKSVFLILLLGSLTHSGARWYSSVFLGEKREATHSLFEQELQTVYQLVDNAMLEDDSPIIWIHDDWYPYADKQVVASWAGASPMKWEAFLAHPKNTSQPVRLWFHLSEDSLIRELERIFPPPSFPRRNISAGIAGRPVFEILLQPTNGQAAVHGQSPTVLGHQYSHTVVEAGKYAQTDFFLKGPAPSRK